MSDKLDIAVVVLTYNEEIHIRRCLENIRQFSDRIFVVDSFSTDRTVEIAKEMGAVVAQNKWENNHAKQFNWGLDHLPFDSKWILRLDADEYLYPETIAEIRELIPTLPDDVTSLSMPRALVWMGNTIRFGTGKVILTRFFRRGFGRSEEKLMDEHIVTSSGRNLQLKGAFVDDNLNDLSWWAHKHVNYAVREAVDLLNIEYGFLEQGSETSNLNRQAACKRNRKCRYARLPLFWRSFAYFLYRYFLRGGFLEGKRGFLWHFLQGWWYRTLVDAKVFEIKRACGGDPGRIAAYVEEKYHISLR